jgi:ribosomal-protein-alanine N-acetyltransferase
MSAQLPYIVEPMTLADLDQVMAIERVAFSAPWSLQAYRYEIIKNEYSTMLVIRQAAPFRGRSESMLSFLGLVRPSSVQGYGGFWLLVDEIHIGTIAVHPKWQGWGLGELLLVSLLDEGIRLGASNATLEVRVSNLPAQGLYHKYGFSVVSRQNRYYADNNEDAYLMSTPLFETPEFQANLHRCRTQLLDRLGTVSGQARADSTRATRLG